MQIAIFELHCICEDKKESERKRIRKSFIVLYYTRIRIVLLNVFKK